MAKHVIAFVLGLMLALPARAASEAEIFAHVRAGDFEAARAGLEARNPSAADRAFLEGTIARASGDLPGAVIAFRTALEADPDFLAARRELAHALLLGGAFGPAKFHFEALQASDPDPAMHDVYQNALNLIAQNRPVALSGHVALLPSTNVNRGSANTIFDTDSGRFVIDPDSRATSGIGFSLGAAGHFQRLLDPKSRLALDWQVSGALYENDILNTATGEVALSYERLIPGGRWTLAPFVSRTLREDDATSLSTGARFALSRRIGERHQGRIALSYGTRRFDDRDNQDGPFGTVALEIARQISPSLSISGGLGYEMSRPDSTHLQFDGLRAFGGVERRWSGGLSTRLSLELGARAFIGDYPLTTSPRDDSYGAIGIGLSHSRIRFKGFAPTLTCSHQINRSNVSFYEYTSTECQAGLTRNF